MKRLTESTASFTTPERRERCGLRAAYPALNATLWATQALAAVMLGRAGLMMITMPRDEVAGHLGDWVTSLSVSTLHGLGVGAVAGAFGVVAPSILRMAPRLAAAVAGALAVMLTLAAVLHGVRGEVQPLVFDVALVAMLLFIGWGRAFKSLIIPHAHLRF
jgi:putative oxidoreductase